ncbi:PucR family transcriptional regulator [Mycobacterium vicinigordonae]|uniref:PucR family transcriptional regulator n=1 Tax=Mycobacterium vicinigordonae TaxID=1719132 RepID=A0A7D6I5Q7_9MYCO|nr:PucR family transcriptional regulator [Mycobacterium vicinigordonae]QLL05237.1 PucR family transcriptional regulator [Mycobacterium vicinigordonae]
MTAVYDSYDIGTPGCVVMIVTRLQKQTEEISTTMRKALEEQIPELGADARMSEMLAAGIQANIETIFDALLRNIPVAGLSAPPAALDYARRAAQHDLPVTVLIRGYRLGQRNMTQRVFAELQALDIQTNTKVAVIEAITTKVLEYVDRVSQLVVAEYEAERSHWLENQDSIRAMRVRDVLIDSADVDSEKASATIDYPLHERHLALIGWYPERAAPADALSRIQRFIRVLASTVDTSSNPLFAVADHTSAWIWLPFRSAPSRVVADIRAFARGRADSPHMALGAVGTGVAGFRRSHRQAQRVRAAVLARGWEQPSAQPIPDRTIAAATDPDMVAAALLGTGAAEIRGWVADVLGALASDTADDARLREALRVFLQSGSLHEVAARELNVTFTALKSHLERAVARRGRPIDDRLDVELALFTCHRYGPTVLRPT